MRTRSRRFPLFLVLSALIIAGCVTINLYFPEQEVKDLAGKIEKQVQAQAQVERTPGDEPITPAEPAAPPPGDRKPATNLESRNRGSVGLFGTLLGVTPAHAQQVPEPETTNPAIRKIIDSRAARLAEINSYKSSGVIGENNKGDLEIRDLGAVSDLRARAEVQKLVRAENADREQLYREIAAAKNIDPSQLDKVRETYAETLRENARSGDWIQMPDGSWKQKA
jgi:uncharacterized protein YdbL (DUF1318 family)